MLWLLITGEYLIVESIVENIRKISNKIEKVKERNLLETEKSELENKNDVITEETQVRKDIPPMPNSGNTLNLD